MAFIHDQLRARRKQLGLKQNDMRMRAGIVRQQYHRLENGGNPSLTTLELAAAGLDRIVMLVPKERLRAVRELLEQPTDDTGELSSGSATESPNPWNDILGSVGDE